MRNGKEEEEEGEEEEEEEESFLSSPLFVLLDGDALNFSPTISALFLSPPIAKNLLEETLAIYRRLRINSDEIRGKLLFSWGSLLYLLCCERERY